MNQLIAVIVSAIGLISAGAASARDATPFASAGKESFVHRDVSPKATLAITVETYVPATCAAKPCPLVISMHGLTRNAARARDNWIEAADRHGLLIAAPEFDRERFPTRLYQQGGIADEPDRANWVYATVERLYDAARATGRIAGDGYVLFGHSAGAQFVHRMVLLMPEARFSTAISANAGYYTLPVLTREKAGGFAWPFSFAGTPATESGLKAAFGKRLVVLLGDADDDPDHFQLNRSKGAEAQGPHRFARGRFFLAAAKAEAVRLGVASAWSDEIIAGVGHEQTKMAAAAADVVFGRR